MTGQGRRLDCSDIVTLKDRRLKIYSWVSQKLCLCVLVMKLHAYMHVTLGQKAAPDIHLRAFDGGGLLSPVRIRATFDDVTSLDAASEKIWDKEKAMYRVNMCFFLGLVIPERVS